jgi:hypothetical protein
VTIRMGTAKQIKRFERNFGWPSARQIGPQLGPGGAEADTYVKVETPGFAGVSRGSGGGIRTRDLRVMSPTSYLTAPPRGVLNEFSRRGSERQRRGAPRAA